MGIKQLFSASELALLSQHLVVRLPNSIRGCRDKAKRESWPSRQVNGKGGPNGILNEYLPPPELAEAISVFLESRPDFFGSAPRVKMVEVFHDESLCVERYCADHASSSQLLIHENHLIKKVELNADSGLGGVPSRYLKLVHVYGDGMEPLLSDGDEVFIDIRCNAFDGDALYAIRQHGRIMIKRVQVRLDGSVAIKYDNDGGFPIEVYSAENAKDVEVVGKVMPFKFGKFRA